MESTSAGAIIYNPILAKYVIIEQDPGVFSIPKGRVEPGETFEAATLREIKEETGLDQVKLLGKIGIIIRPNAYDPTEIKHIHVYFALTSTVIFPVINSEVIGPSWVSLNQLISQTSFPNDKDFLSMNKQLITRKSVNLNFES